MVAGTVNLDDNFYAKKLEVSVAAGEFTNDSTITAEKAELTVGTGNIDLENLKVQNLEADCGIGHEKKISNPGSSGKMTFDCGVGNITVDFE